MLSTVVSRKSLRFAVLGTALLAVAAYAAQSAQARNVYVTNGGAADTVSVISDASNAITNTIPVGDNPAGLAITPDGSKVFVANSIANTVSVIDTATNAVVASPAVGTSPYGVAVSPDGTKAYVTNVDSISVINVATNTVSSTISALAGGLSSPRGVAVSPDGSRLYVANFDNDTVSVINTATSSNDFTVNSVGTDPDGIAVTPDGSKVFVVALNGVAPNAGVTVIKTNTLDKSTISAAGFGFNPRGIAITPDGSKAYITNSGGASNSAAVIDTSTDAVTTTIGVGANPLFPAVNPAGTRLYVPNSGATTASVVDTSSNSSIASISGLTAPFAAAVAPAQAPTASVTATAAAACADTSFDGSASTDSDGTVASYVWNFGDDKTATTTHAYDKAGAYTATLTVTDNEGASTQKVFTGQTMSRNGSSSAAKSTAVTIDSPAAATVTVSTPQARKKYKRSSFRKIKGAASGACSVKQVNYALALSKGGKCRFLGNTGKLGRTRRSCSKPIFRKAKLSGKKWSKTLGHRLPKGAYRLFVRAKNSADVTSSSKRVRFRLR